MQIPGCKKGVLHVYYSVLNIVLQIYNESITSILKRIISFIMKRAADYFHGQDKYNCCQAIRRFFQRRFDVSEEVLQEGKAHGGGRAPEGVCGALYAAEELLKASGELKAELRAAFLKRVGAITCREIKGEQKTSCQECVNVASELLQEFADRAGSAPKTGEILSNELLTGDYFQVKFYVPEICDATMPGQFVHVQIADLKDRILRRPFSINDVDDNGALTVTYKVVGEGTEHLSHLKAGAVCNVLGPLGNGFSAPEADEVTVAVGGGYGAAALYLLTRSAQEGVLLLGARSAADLLLTEEYEKAGFKVRVATDDGSAGHQGRVTELVEALIMELGSKRKLKFYACGPGPMLMALAKILLKHGYNDSELSVDHLMCCGVGACFSCVVKVKDGNGSFRYARSCSEGPVFRADEIYLEQ